MLWKPSFVFAGSRGGIILAASVDDELPTIAEVEADAELYRGPEDLDYVHPNQLPMEHPWTAEEFSNFYTDGRAAWETPTDLAVAVGFVDDRRKRDALHMDHLYWARKSEINATKIYASYVVDEGAVVAAVGEDKFELLEADPLKDVYDRREIYHWKLSGDPYLEYEISEVPPFCILRFIKKKSPKHLSFLRKTKRVHKVGTLRRLNETEPIGELLFAFFGSKKECLRWLESDPSEFEIVWCSRYSDLAVSSHHITQPYPWNLLADPLKARLVEDGILELPERHVTRIELDDTTGKYRAYNITTRDPRITSNYVAPTPKPFVLFDDDDDDPSLFMEE